MFILVVLQVAVCNLASLAVNMYVKDDRTYDFDRLAHVSKVITRNLNKIIEINFYPIEEVSASSALLEKDLETLESHFATLYFGML